MAAKFFLVLCASALFVKTISSQCLRGPYDAAIIGNGMIADGFGLAANDFGYGAMAANALAYDALPLAAGYGGGLAYGNVAPASGRGFPVTSSSPIAPVGISVASENAIEGILAVSGELPVLGAVALEGALPTVGSGSIVYGCGNGAIGIVSEGVEPAARLGYGNALAAELGYGAPLAGGLGYGNALAAELGYGAPLAAGLGYGALLADGLGYGAGLGFRGVGPVVGPGCGYAI